MKLEAQSPLGAPFGTARPVVGFKTNGVSLRERADVGCVLLTATEPVAVSAPGSTAGAEIPARASGSTAGADIPARANAAAGVDLPVVAGETRTREGRTTLWLSPRSWLIQCRVDEEQALALRLNAAFPAKQAHAVPFTDALCWLEIFGVESQECLTEGGFVSLEHGGLTVGHAKRTLVAGVPVIVIHERESVWIVGVERSRARYFADWLNENSHLPSFKRLA
jgi:heterotetrameric sarcosine oxidase gamma subunit